MQIVVLAAMAVSMVFLVEGAPAWAAPAWVVAAAGAGYWAVTAALSRTGSVLGVRAMARTNWQEKRATRLQALLTVATRLWLVAGLAGLIVLGYGRWITQDLQLERWPLVGKAAVVAPFIVALLLNWILEYPLHRASRRRLAEATAAYGHEAPPAWTRGQFLGNNVRHQLLFIIAPVGIIVLATDVLELYVRPMLPAETGPYIVAIAAIGAACTVFLLVPLLIVRIWRTERLADGPLRRQLEELCRRLNLRFREMLVWKSGGVIANAGVIGLLPSVRYVLLSDALLARMSDKHIRSIFAHEAGHVRHRHILYAVLFVLVVVSFSATLVEVVHVAVPLSLWQGQLAALVFVAAGFAVGFGWVSRRFERQSDVMAAWVASWDDRPEREPDDTVSPQGAEVFATALEQVACLNGMSAYGRNWRHGSIASRLGYIRRLGGRYGSRREIGRVVRYIKIALLAGLAVSMGLMVWEIVAALV